MHEQFDALKTDTVLKCDDAAFNGEDAALFGEIAALLQATPSPQLLARVRSRIEEQSFASGAGMWRRALALTSAAAAVIAVIAVAVYVGIDASQPATRTFRVNADVELTADIANAGQGEQAPHRLEPVVRKAVVRPATLRRPEASQPKPVVLISPAEAAGLRYFISAMQAGTVTPQSLPEERLASEIDIEPITVAPLIAVARLTED
jgi:hypothetical protein